MNLTVGLGPRAEEKIHLDEHLLAVRHVYAFENIRSSQYYFVVEGNQKCTAQFNTIQKLISISLLTHNRPLHFGTINHFILGLRLSTRPTNTGLCAEEQTVQIVFS